jgi:hypothetical protein
MPHSANRLKGTVHNDTMTGGRPKLLKDLLAGRSLAGLAERAAATDRLARRIQTLLPAELAPHVTGANVRDRRLVVLVDGPVWAARLRFEAPALRRRLESEQEIDVDAVTVRVRRGP